MKVSLILMLTCIIALAAVIFAAGDEKDARGKSTSRVSPTDVVVSYYNVLLQEKAPTLEQEQALIQPNSVLRGMLIHDGQGKENDPVVLTFLRKHKDVFLPGHTPVKDATKFVLISQEFRFARDLEHAHEQPGPVQVLVTFPDDPKAVPPRDHSILFMLEDSRIIPDAITVDGKCDVFMDQNDLKLK